MSELTSYLKEKRALIDQALKDHLPSVSTRPSVLHEAMCYSVLSGGKRLRPILCLAASEVFAAPLSRSLLPALALELFHCFTLIHDDLPCMDDDDLRRGLPTCHIKYGEANAVLAGDALVIHAFQLLAEHGNPQLIKELTLAGGSAGVIGGQVEDLAAEGQPPNADLVEFIHQNKTAALIRAAVRMGAISGGASESELENMSLFGEKIGLAFQIEDDILDETSTNEVLGKPTGADLELRKMTYPAVHGMDAAREKVHSLTNEAIAALNALPCDTSTLKSIADYLIHRTY